MASFAGPAAASPSLLEPPSSAPCVPVSLLPRPPLDRPFPILAVFPCAVSPERGMRFNAVCRALQANKTFVSYG